MKILVTGGSGYLGQFIVRHLAAKEDVAFTYNTRALEEPQLQLLGGARALKLDLKTGAGLRAYEAENGPPDLVINCAAMSVPRECEADPEAAYAINVPTALVQWLASLGPGRQPLLIHLSTDQVYDGSKAFWREDDELAPVNTYGATKKAAEDLIRQKCADFAILRSSIIVGPAPPVPLAKSLPLQWMDKVLAAGTATDFFADEFRCPVFVLDIVLVVEALVARWQGGERMQHVLNVGGPDRLSRADMARAMARARHYSEELVNPVPASSVNRGVQSPPDISMDISRLRAALGVEMTRYDDAIRQTLIGQPAS